MSGSSGGSAISARRFLRAQFKRLLVSFASEAKQRAGAFVLGVSAEPTGEFDGAIQKVGHGANPTTLGTAEESVGFVATRDEPGGAKLANPDASPKLRCMTWPRLLNGGPSSIGVALHANAIAVDLRAPVFMQSASFARPRGDNRI